MNISRSIRSLASLLRWRLKPVRWATKIVGEVKRLPKFSNSNPPRESAQHEILQTLITHGYAKAATALDFPPIEIESLAGRAKNRSFIDISADYPEEVAQAYINVMSQPGVQDTVLRYFNGRPWLWNVALNYSDVSVQRTDSQLWHFDYGDIKQLHFMAYFSDIDTDSGPFTFFDAGTSAQVSRHPLLIERFTDEDLKRSFEIDAAKSAIRLEGLRGDVFVADPGRVLHQGARCRKPRLVLFITFTTPAPMSRGGRSTIAPRARKRLWRKVSQSGIAVIPMESYF